MRRTYKVYFKDIVDAIQNIEEYTRGFGYEEFRVNKLVKDAVIRNLEVIGEAVKNLPEEVGQKFPETNWRKIAGLRDILIHRYFEVDTELIWDIVKNELPNLKAKVSAILAK
jgi:uncharacterized protein with HEPN domain